MTVRILPRQDAVITQAAYAAATNIADLCEIMAMEASNLSPRDTGNNASSITSEVERKGLRITGRVYTQTGYGGWLEVGTSRMAARPYMAPAYRFARAKFRG